METNDKNNYYQWPVEKNNPYPDGELYYGKNKKSKLDALSTILFGSWFRCFRFCKKKFISRHKQYL